MKKLSYILIFVLLAANLVLAGFIYKRTGEKEFDLKPKGLVPLEAHVALRKDTIMADGEQIKLKANDLGEYETIRLKRNEKSEIIFPVVEWDWFMVGGQSDIKFEESVTSPEAYKKFFKFNEGVVLNEDIKNLNRKFIVETDGVNELIFINALEYKDTQKPEDMNPEQYKLLRIVFE